jgi:hypothetical protein
VGKILLIDDQPAVLDELHERIRAELLEHEAEIEKWLPGGTGSGPLSQLKEKVGNDTVLVVTDWDLTMSKAGVYGDTLVGWCKRQAIPAALYSRGGDLGDPTAKPDLFELKIPRGEEAGRHIAEMYRGFKDLAAAIDQGVGQHPARGPATVLAAILGEPDLEHEFAQYTLQIGDASGALTTLVMKTAPPNAQPAAPGEVEIRRVLTYVLGHLLLNAILPYPGPLLPMSALCGYVGTTEAEGDALAGLFEHASYVGPFRGLDSIFWRHKVDAIIEGLLEAGTESEAYLIRRHAVERAVERQLARHGCERCGGVNGGFYCPFTKRAVCARSDCSTGSNSWLPLGATACRIELSFFEEWAPLLGF